MHSDLRGLIAGTIIPPTADPYAHTYYDTEQRVQEFRLTSPGGQRFDYLLGLVYSDIDTVRPYGRFIGLAAIDENWGSRFAMKSSALFARGTWNVGARDALTAGLRYQYDDMDYALAFFPTVPTATIPDSEVAGDNQYDFLTAELSWRHTLADDVNAYITLAHAQSGQVYDLEDWRGGLEDNGLQPLDSQKVRNIELGLKGQWWQRKLTANINAFWARYDNYHLESFREAADPQTPAIVKLYAIGEVETKGIELTSRLRATQRLDLGLNAAWIKAEIKHGIRIKTKCLQLPESLPRKFSDSVAIEAFAKFVNLIKASWVSLGDRITERCVSYGDKFVCLQFRFSIIS